MGRTRQHRRPNGDIRGVQTTYPGRETEWRTRNGSMRGYNFTLFLRGIWCLAYSRNSIIAKRDGGIERPQEEGITNPVGV